MDWQTLSASMSLADNDYPPRRATLLALQRVLQGSQYDHLDYAFGQERTDGGEYVPLSRRRPSVRNGWCRTVVDDSVSMLFGQGRWPAITASGTGGAESPTVTALRALTEATHLAGTMMEAATVGSVGSVAILFRVLRNRPYFDVLNTACLTPKWQVDAPRTLASVTELYKAKRADLLAAGYTDLPVGEDTLWFQRTWDAQEETWFVPWPAGMQTTSPHVPVRDDRRSVVHALGVVPVVWVRNLPGGNAVDGACTFSAGLDTEIEADYQLSQGGRGLKYSSDPTLLIKEPAASGAAPARIGGAAAALILPDGGDARLLEISGSASAAVIGFADHLHKVCMGAVHGDGSDRDKMSTAQSGRAMELLKQPLVWLTSRLRMSYGDDALVQLYRLVCVASQRVAGGVICGDTAARGLDADGLALIWPPFFHATYDDKMAEATAVSTLLSASAMSRKTAVQTVSESYDVSDVDAELTAISADELAETATLRGRETQVSAVAKQVADM